MIKSIKAKNFLSWSDLSFVVQDGVTLIDGWNQDDQTSEGSGKSAILNALTWGLYGKIPKDARIDDVIKDGADSCSVYIELNIRGINGILRTRKPNDLMLIDTAGNKHKGKDAKETQSIIEQLIGLTFDTFCQTIYFAQNYPKKFITATQADRGSILAEIQDLSIFDRAQKEAKKQTNLLKTEETSLTHKVHLVEANVLRLKDLIHQQEQFAEQQKVERDARIAVLTQKIETLHKDLKQNKQEQADITPHQDSSSAGQLNQQLNILAAQKNELVSKEAATKLAIKNVSQNNKIIDNYKTNIELTQNKIDTLKKQARDYVEFIKNPTKKCPTCGIESQRNDVDDLKSELVKLHGVINHTETELQMLCTEYAQLTTQTPDELYEIINKINAAKMELDRNSALIQKEINTIEHNKHLYDSLLIFENRIKAEIQETTESIDLEKKQQIDINTDKIQELVQQLKQEQGAVEELKPKLKQTQLKLSQLETLKNGFKQVKAYTFNSVLNELSHKANQYLTELFEVPVTINFKNDNMKIVVGITMDGTERGYGLLSGGQQRRVGLAVDLALSDITSSRNTNKINLKILDEYFKDLSESSMQKSLKLLEKLGGATILIEHNSIFKSVVDRVYNVELVDGTSTQTDTVSINY